MIPGPDRLRTVLVIAQSARALAAAARRAGFAVAAIDHFADADTQDLAAAAIRYPGGLRCGFRRATLLPLVERAAAAVGGVDAVVLGSGFEDRPKLVDALAAAWPVAGCPADAIRAAKDPFQLAALCRDTRIPHPDVRQDPALTGAWLVRRRGGSGGGHIRPYECGEAVPAGHVLVERLPGEPVSAAALADGRRAEVFAFCRQILDPCDGAPFRFAGVAGPVRLPGSVEEGLRRAAALLAPRLGLRGLVGLDALVDGDRWWLLEVNPRPGAALDALDRTDVPLFSAHLRASAGEAVLPRLVDATIRATRVVYASADSSVPADMAWPDWVMDRPAAGTRIGAGDPIATVTAEAADWITLNERLDNRARDLPLILEGCAR